MPGLIISMEDTEAQSLEQAYQRREEVYRWTEGTLVLHRYTRSEPEDKGLLRWYIANERV